jgi:hypothetical protein
MTSVALRKKDTDVEAKRKLTIRVLVLMLALAAFMLTGCGNSSSSDSTEDTGTNVTTDTGDDGSSSDTGDDGDTTDTGDTNGPPDMGDGGAPPDMEGGPTDSGGTDIDKTGAYEQDGGTVTESAKTYAATETDESAVYVYGSGIYTLDDGTLSKTGETSSDADSNFYGNNAIVLAEGESTITLTGCSLTADSEGSNGAFAYGEGSSVILDDCDISTTGHSSRGVDATYGGIIDISNSTISTQGNHCAALATDRYENNDPPTIIAADVVGTTAGEGSPGIYCTGTFSVSDCNLTATGSEAAVIEGMNTILLTNSNIEGAVKWGVFIYQSMSGDSSEGMGTFDMTGGSITSKSTGPVFMVCNTEATIYLEDVDITTSGDVLIRATDSSSGDANINSDWGTAGGDVTFNATDQALVGTISINEKSSLDMTLSGTSTLSGDVADDDGEVNITLEDSARWTATGDSYVNSLDGVTFSGSTPVNVDAGSGITIYYGSGTGLSGSYALSAGGQLQAL